MTKTKRDVELFQSKHFSLLYIKHKFYISYIVQTEHKNPNEIGKRIATTHFKCD